MTERVVDLFEAVEIDKQERHAAAARRAARRVRLQRALHIHPVRQPRQEVVEGIVLDAGARRFEFGVARLRQRLGARQVLRQRDVGGHVPIDADDFRGQIGRNVDLADRADDPRSPIAQVKSVLRFVAAFRAYRRFEILDRPLGVALVEPIPPMPVFANAAVERIIVELVHAVVPDQLLGVDVEVPHADLRGVEGEFEAPRQPLELPFAIAQTREVVASFLHQPPGEPGGNDDQEAGGENSQPQNPAVRRRRLPAAFGRGGDPPRSRGHAHVGDDRTVARDARLAEEADSFLAPRVRARDRDVDRQIVADETAVAVQPVDVDDRRNDAPERLVAAGLAGEHRKTGDEAPAALDQVERTGQHHVAAVARAQRGFALLFVLAIVEPDHRLVTLQGIFQGHDETGGAGDAPDPRAALQQIRAKLGEARLRDVRLGGNVADEAANELDVAVDVALELGPDQADLGENLGARSFVGKLAVLMVGERAADEGDDRGDRRRDVRRAKKMSSQGIAQGHDGIRCGSTTSLVWLTPANVGY